MDSKKPNKITEIVRLQQILKKWKKLANASKNTTTTTTTNSGGHKSIKFLKKTLSFSDVSGSISVASNDVVVPKGHVAVCVGKELKRFTIPTEYLSHRAFGMLLREAEEEFGFQQEGVLKIPCEVPLFEKVLKMVAENKEIGVGCCSPDCERTPTHHHHHHPAQLCR